MRSNDALRAACRAAYERSQRRRALLEVAPVVPMTLLALLGTGTALPIAIGALLAVAAGLLSWRGGDAAAGVSPGLAGGALLVSVPLIAEQCAVVCVGPWCWSTCVAVCAAAGLGAGVILAQSWPAGASAEQRITSLSLASLAAAMGCIEVSLVGFALALVALTLSGSALAAGRR